jgi:A nuclease family of the HNH/ENDO VII superfamily with conserved AHH
MTEILEVLAPPAMHKEPNDKCPFCPPPEPIKYTTYPGAKNNSSHLADIMEKPEKLTSLQSGARPQTAKEDKSGFVQEQSKPTPRKQDTSKFYTHQAHHLISGNQALKGSPMEDWILASDKNEKDTGYSVNSTGNGFWAPSVPKKWVGKWGPTKKKLTDVERQTLAEEVMAAANAQAHIGPHNIADPDDPLGKHHMSYDVYIKKQLAAMSKRIKLWSDKCGFCKPDGKKKKPQATHKVHDMLDKLSTHLQKEITGSRKNWRIFLSKYAMEYHKQVCSHAKKPRKKL